jgi:hypothetical protein
MIHILGTSADGQTARSLCLKDNKETNQGQIARLYVRVSDNVLLIHRNYITSTVLPLPMIIFALQ